MSLRPWHIVISHVLKSCQKNYQQSEHVDEVLFTNGSECLALLSVYFSFWYYLKWAYWNWRQGPHGSPVLPCRERYGQTHQAESLIFNRPSLCMKIYKAPYQDSNSKLGHNFGKVCVWIYACKLWFQENAAIEQRIPSCFILSSCFNSVVTVGDGVLLALMQISYALQHPSVAATNKMVY